jgi:hypothetical protein
MPSTPIAVARWVLPVPGPPINTALLNKSVMSRKEANLQSLKRFIQQRHKQIQRRHD